MKSCKVSSGFVGTCANRERLLKGLEAVNDADVLRLAADIIQRKVTTVVTGAVDKTASRPIVEALVNCGSLLNTIEQLRNVADVFDENAGGR